MSIICECSQCGKQYRVEDDAGGKKLRCRRCANVIRIPRPAPPVTAGRQSRFSPLEPDLDESVNDFVEVEVIPEDEPVRRRPQRTERTERESLSQSMPLEAEHDEYEGVFLSSFWNLPANIREWMLAFGAIAIAGGVSFTERDLLACSVCLGLIVMGLIIYLVGSVWMWMKVRPINSGLWTIGFIIGGIPALNEIYYAICVAKHWDELNHPYNIRIVGMVLMGAAFGIMYLTSMHILLPVTVTT